MPIKTFDDLASLSEHFTSHVFRDIANDTLVVQDQMNNSWYRYRWTQGRREIKFLETIGGELPIMVQEYPAL